MRGLERRLRRVEYTACRAPVIPYPRLLCCVLNAAFAGLFHVPAAGAWGMAGVAACLVIGVVTHRGGWGPLQSLLNSRRALGPAHEL